MPTALQNEVRSLLRTATAPLESVPSASAEGSPAATTPGAVALVLRRGEVVAHEWAGAALAYRDARYQLSVTEQRPVRADTVFDLASLTKIVTAVATLIQVDRGHLTLDSPVATMLPELLTGHEDHPLARHRAEITVHHLLTHTAGLPAEIALEQVRGNRATRAAAVLGEPLLSVPGRRHTYSCVGYLILGLLLERISGSPLPELVAGAVTGPLGMSETFYDEVPAQALARTAATEDQPARGLVHGTVHDEAAWALGGAGNAGLFSTAQDVARLGQAILAGELLSAEQHRALATDQLAAGPRPPTGYGQACGLRIDDASFMARAPAGLLGHTGFTGTSLVIDPAQQLVVVLLTNRVHPRRDRCDVGLLRRDVLAAAHRWAAGEDC